ncbi:MAG: hypothetical protein Q8R15_02690, partial [Candidatus Micrarchaeota archaeon]|nr:hypothetical protein [Candidatus Micrarchaeota archaeon]
KSNIFNMLNVVKFHLKHYENTGTMPERGNPAAESWKKADEILNQHFPNLTGTNRSSYRRAAALALENRLAVGSAHIYMQQKIVQKNPHAFLYGLRKTLEPKIPVIDLLEQLKPKLRIAAQRGEKAAKTALNSTDSDVISGIIRRIQAGKGITSRHPDLFADGPFKPHRIREIHPAALRTKLNIIRALARDGNQSGKIMLMFTRGKETKEIARELGLSKDVVELHLGYGAHTVFGIEPKGNSALIGYHKIRRWNPHLFAEPKKRVSILEME